MPAWRPSMPLLSRCKWSGRLARWPTPLDAHLRDTPPVDPGDPEAVAFDLDRVADGREPAEPAENHPADRVVGLVRKREPKTLAQRVERRESVDDERARSLFLERGGFGIEFILDFAHQLLEHVLKRYHARGSAELVHDDREPHPLAAKLGERLIEAHRLGHDRHFPHDVPRFR